MQRNFSLAFGYTIFFNGNSYQLISIEHIFYFFVSVLREDQLKHHLLLSFTKEGSQIDNLKITHFLLEMTTAVNYVIIW